MCVCVWSACECVCVCVCVRVRVPVCAYNNLYGQHFALCEYFNYYHCLLHDALFPVVTKVRPVVA